MAAYIVTVDKVRGSPAASAAAITSDTYTPVLPEVAYEAAEGIAALVPRKIAGGEASKTAAPVSVRLTVVGAPTTSIKKSGPPGHWGSEVSRRGESNP